MKHLLAIVLLTTSLVGFAAETGRVDYAAESVQSSSISISTSDMGIGYASGSIGLTAQVAPRVQYFVIDRLALGVQASMTYMSGRSLLMTDVGPVASYTFWNSEQVSTYGGAGYMFRDIGRASQYSNAAYYFFEVGANYHFTSWFAGGPRVSYVISRDTNSTKTLNLNLINLYFTL